MSEKDSSKKWHYDSMLTANLILPRRGETLIIEPAEEESPDTLFEEAYEFYPAYRIEQDSEGCVLIMSPTGGKSSLRNNAILFQLTDWAARDNRGKVFESNILFVLPDGSKRGPDAAWVSDETLLRVPPDQENDFLPVVPEFVIELRSKSDRLARLQSKMRDWVGHGVQVAWLIDADQKRVWIYRQGSPDPETLDAPVAVVGEGPVAGFQLQTESIWKGLRG